VSLSKDGKNLNMKVALLGATGFVGTNVSKILELNNVEYIPVSRKRHSVDLCDPVSTLSFFERIKPDFVINCAAHVGSLNYVTEQAATVVHDNSLMILSMYQAIAKSCPNATVLNPIANCAYPAKSDIFTEEEWWNGHLHRSVLSYGATRRMLWAIGESYAMQHGIRTINLLVPNMYGPHDSTDPNKAHALNALISKFVKVQKSKESQIVIWGTGVAIREWLYAEDFGRVVLKILQNPNMIGLSEPLNVGQNFGLSVKELVEIIRQNFKFGGKIIWDHQKPDGAPKKVMDDRRFQKVFGDFKFTEFTHGIANTINYYDSIYPY
jgi:GDP-L-fucose synthase